jgi:hypothetical protein
MANKDRGRLHGAGIILASFAGLALYAVAYATNGWYGVGVVLGVSLLVIVALALDDRYYENDGE